MHVVCVHAAMPRERNQLPPYGGNSQLGCGLVVREIKGRRYLYFWAYEIRSWGSRRVWTYVGPTDRARTRARAQELLLEYHEWARRDMDRRVAILARSAAGVR